MNPKPLKPETPLDGEAVALLATVQQAIRSGPVTDDYRLPMAHFDSGINWPCEYMERQRLINMLQEWMVRRRVGYV